MQCFQNKHSKPILAQSKKKMSARTAKTYCQQPTWNNYSEEADKQQNRWQW